MSFSDDIQKFTIKANGKTDNVVAGIVFDIATRIDFRSPVGQPEIWAANIDRATRGLPPLPKGYVGGRFRANWQLGVNVRPSGEINGVDPTGEATLGKVLSEIPKQAAGNIYYLVNNLPYAQALEDGHSTQAPSGMVGLTVLEWASVVQDNAKGA